MEDSKNFEGFSRRGSKSEIETGTKFQPKFDKNGLIACIVTDAKSKEILMFGHCEAEDLIFLIKNRKPNFILNPWFLDFPLQIVELLTDCDQDAIHIKVNPENREYFFWTKVEVNNINHLNFDNDELIACIVTDVESKEVLMLGYMNATSLNRTIEKGEAWYWSRSRKKYWKKGETSGQVQKIVSLKTNQFRNAVHIRVRVEGNGATCHLGYRSCFHRKLIGLGKTPNDLSLERLETERLFDPAEVYKNS